MRQERGPLQTTQKKDKNSECLSPPRIEGEHLCHRRRHDRASPLSRILTLAGNSKDMELARILRSCLSPATPQFRPQSLHDLCIRTAAVYATTSLYEFHDKRSVCNGLVLSVWHDTRNIIL